MRIRPAHNVTDKENRPTGVKRNGNMFNSPNAPSIPLNADINGSDRKGYRRGNK